MAALLTKAHNKGYTRKDGTHVKPFDDKRPSAKPDPVKPKAGKPKADKQAVHAPQFGLFGWMPPPAGVTGPGAAAGKPAMPKAYHPRSGDAGEKVGIYQPTEPSGPDTWADPKAVATFVPAGDVPAALHGVPFRVWRDHPRTTDGWDYVDGQMDDLDEPKLHVPAGKGAASGVIVEEDDGRVWLVHPTNKFAGYDATFPKGSAEQELSLQANAIKECFEESGLKVQITGFVGDFERGTTVARYYRARRVGGTPVAMGWESQAVSLVPKDRLMDMLNGKVDHPVAVAAGAPKPADVQAVDVSGWEQIGGQAGSNVGGFYVDADGDEWYCKFPKTSTHAKNEVLAAKLYEAVGVRVPDVKLVERDGKVGVASRVIPVLVRDPEGLISGDVKGVREGFAADCWLANWDSVGLLHDNMLADKNGEAVRLDTGGALVFRAQGSPKGEAFGSTVGEIDSLRSGKNAQAAEVFAGVTDDDIRAGVKKIVALGDDAIHDLVNRYGWGGPADRNALAAKLIARKADLAARYGVSIA